MSNIIVSLITLTATIYIFFVAKEINKLINERLNLLTRQRKALIEYRELLQGYENELMQLKEELKQYHKEFEKKQNFIKKRNKEHKNTVATPDIIN